jgi:DNA invertase Pin-like site-specific DNA recombinase
LGHADTRGLEIVRTYADAGKSGIKIDGRDALKQLIDDVQTGAADFTMILVYDVSRWGRFQDADESAYYEYICKRAGISVQYCAEQFENDGSPVSTIVKGVKRAMAGEYSRELAEDNDLQLDAYRFETLDFFYDIAAPVRISEAA